MNIVFAYPAYNRKYFTKQQVLQDWHEGKDFRMDSATGPYFSIRDLISFGNKVQIILPINDFSEQVEVTYGFVNF